MIGNTKNKRNLIVILSLVALLLMAFAIFFICLVNYKFERTNVKPANKASLNYKSKKSGSYSAAKNEEARREKINNFAIPSDDSDTEVSNIGNGGGISNTINIVNRNDLLNKGFTDLDQMLEIDRQLQCFMNSIIEYNNSNRCNKLKQYYNQNKDKISELISIDNYNDFNNFVRPLSAFGNSKKISYAQIDNIGKNSEGIHFNLKLKSDINTEITLLVMSDFLMIIELLNFLSLR